MEQSNLVLESEGIHHDNADRIQAIRFRGLQTSTARIRFDYGANPLPAARPSVPAADLRLAGLRSLSEISRAQSVPYILARNPRGAAALGHRRAFAAHQTRRDPIGERRIRLALIADPAERGVTPVAPAHISSGCRASVARPRT